MAPFSPHTHNRLCVFYVHLLFIFSFLGFLLCGCQKSTSTRISETSVLINETYPVDTWVPETQPINQSQQSDTIEPILCPIPLDDWRLQLVNRDHPITDDYSVALKSVRSDIQVDSRCYDDLSAMLDACRAEGLDPLICSGYRDLDYQTELFINKVKRLQAKGLSELDAYEYAQTVVALPGTSEHHLGLAVDIVDQSYQELTEIQEQTPVQKWLIQHCWEYGFILRYPDGKSEITGIIYEPWHYRYVGREVAAEIQSSGLCLEEYLDQFTAVLS